MSDNLPPGVLPTDPHIAGADEVEHTTYCDTCGQDQLFTGTMISATEALVYCPECDAEYEIDYRDMWPE